MRSNVVDLRGSVVTRLGKRHKAEPVVKSTTPRGDVVYWVGAAGAEFAVTADAYFVRFHNRPAVAANATNALVLWTDPRAGNSDWNIYARRVLADGTVLDADGPPPVPRPPLTMPATYPGFAITTAWNNQDNPAVAWDGSQYLAAWEDPRANLFFLDQRTDIFGAQVSAAGALLDPDGFALANSSLPEISPAVAGSSGASVFAASIFSGSAALCSLSHRCASH